MEPTEKRSVIWIWAVLDAVICTAEQDIANYETTSPALRPGPGASQQAGWRSSHRFWPYDKKDHRPADTGDQEQQTWR